MILSSVLLTGLRYDTEKPKYTMPESNVEFFLEQADIQIEEI